MIKRISIFIFILLFSQNIFAENIIKKENSLTPMDFYLKSINKNLTSYQLYSTFLIKEKLNGDLKKFKRILNSNDKYLNYYEGIIKGLYNFYYNDQIIGLKFIDKVYDRNFNNVENTTEAIFLQNIFLNQNYINKAKKIFSNKNICLIQDNSYLKNSCIANNIVVNYLNKKDYLFDLLYLNSINKKLAEYTLKYSIIKDKNLKEEKKNNEKK